LRILRARGGELRARLNCSTVEKADDRFLWPGAMACTVMLALNRRRGGGADEATFLQAAGGAGAALLQGYINGSTLPRG
jgi:hypothetical protein